MLSNSTNESTCFAYRIPVAAMFGASARKYLIPLSLRPHVLTTPCSMRIMWATPLYVLFLAVVVTARTPKFKWGQDATSLYVSIDIQCSGNRKVHLSDDHFGFECTSSNDHHKLDFVLREVHLCIPVLFDY